MTTSTSRPWRLLGALLLAFALALVACSADDDDASVTSADNGFSGDTAASEAPASESEGLRAGGSDDGGGDDGGDDGAAEPEPEPGGGGGDNP